MKELISGALDNQLGDASLEETSFPSLSNHWLFVVLSLQVDSRQIAHSVLVYLFVLLLLMSCLSSHFFSSFRCLGCSFSDTLVLHFLQSSHPVFCDVPWALGMNCVHWDWVPRISWSLRISFSVVVYLPQREASWMRGESCTYLWV